MKKILALSALMLLAACGGNDISQSDVQNALKQSESGRVCVPFSLDIADSQPGSGMQGIVGMDEIHLLKRQSSGKRANTEAMEQMDILVDAGIYREEGTQRIGEGDNVIRYQTYRLTDKGREHFVSSVHHGSLLCIGHLDVQKIHYFTEPAAANGMTVSKVSYEAKIRPERWARKLLKDNPYYEGLNQTQNRRITLVKTNQGWRDAFSLHKP